MANKVILVTGGTGLVGTAIQKNCGFESTHDSKLKDSWMFLGSKDLDLMDGKNVSKSFMHIMPDVVIHLAASVGGLYKNINGNADMFYRNVTMNNNVIEACRRLNESKKVKLICMLSTCIFPDGLDTLTEYQLHDGAPHSSNFGYAYAKRMLQVACEAYKEQYDLDYICLTPCNLYGSNDNFSLEDGHVIPSLVHRAYIAKKQGTSLQIRGTGTAMRQFLHVNDLAKIIHFFATSTTTDKTHAYRHFIVAPEQETSIANVAKMIAEASGIDKITYDDAFSDGQPSKKAHASRLLQVFPDMQFTPIDEGIQATVAWFSDNYPNVRL